MNGKFKIEISEVEVSMKMPDGKKSADIFMNAIPQSDGLSFL